MFAKPSSNRLYTAFLHGLMGLKCFSADKVEHWRALREETRASHAFARAMRAALMASSTPATSREVRELTSASSLIFRLHCSLSKHHIPVAEEGLNLIQLRSASAYTSWAFSAAMKMLSKSLWSETAAGPSASPGWWSSQHLLTPRKVAGTFLSQI